MCAASNGFPLSAQPSLTLSTLCLACKSIFAGTTARNEHSEVPHHGLEALAARASRGCQLCLTVYMSIDPEAFKSLRKSTASPTPTSPADGPPTEPSGWASISPIARDQARLRFRYIRPDSQSPRDGGSSPESERDIKGKSAVRDNIRSIGANTVLSNHSTTSLLSNGRSSSPNARDGGPPVIVELILMNPRYAVEPGVRNISTTSTSTASEESLKIARAWLDECSFNHMKCSVNTNVVMDSGFGGGMDGGSTWKPTHLLDVSIKGPKGAQGVKLVDGMFLDPLSEYITLSHVWGKQKGVRLHKGTLAALRQGVAASSLPKTFAEAAMMAQSLGFRYLWIDALCVMHDSEKDVLKEIGQMGKVYGEAALNIAATGAKDDQQGLVAERNVMALQPCVVAAQGVGIEDGVYKCLRSTIWQDLVDSSPLVKRAWVVQERAVAKRTLHFTRNELLWECQQMCCSEVFPKGLPATMKGGGEADAEGFDKRVHHQRHGNWGGLVRLFSRGRLSYSGDKLLAVGGLARQYMQRNRLRSADYVCGMWKEMLPQGLLWKVERGVRPKKWRAPSWAWASIEGEVVCPEAGQASKEACLELIDVSVKTKGEDPFGQAESAKLKVRGFMARGLLRRTHDYWGQGPCVIECLKAQLEIEAAYFDERLPKLSAIGDRGLTEQVEVYLLPVIDTVDRVEGLILCSNLKRGEFRRLGCFEVSRYDQVNWDRFRSVMKGDPEMQNFEERLDHTNSYWFASDYTYTINIV